MDRQNDYLTLFPSAARTADGNSGIQTNRIHRGAHIVIDVTADPGTASVVFTVQGFDPTSEKFYTILASAAVTAVGTTVLRIYPGLTAAANTAANDVLPRKWRVLADHADAESITYTVGASLVV